MNGKYAELLLKHNEELEQRQEQVAALLVQHDEELNRLLDALPELRKEVLAAVMPDITGRLDAQIPAIIAESFGAAKVEFSAEQKSAAEAAARGLTAIRAELIALAREGLDVVTAEKQRVVSLDEIRATLTTLAQEHANKTARDVLATAETELRAKIEAALEGVPDKTRFATGVALVDVFRGPFKPGDAAKRGEVWTWLGSTFLCVEDTTDTPGRRAARSGSGPWALLAAAGMGGGVGGGDSLPAQLGNGGKFLTTDGTAASWGDVITLPAQTGHGGEYLKTDGTDATWDAVVTIPSVSGHTGEFLTNDGASTSWAALAGGGDMVGANNLSDVVSAITAFNTIKQPATTVYMGAVTLAPAASVTAGLVVQANDARLSDARTPSAHTHVITAITDVNFAVVTFLQTPTSANLAAAVTNETGSGLLVFGTSPVITTPTLTSPTLGTPVSGTLTNCDGTAASLTAGKATVLATARAIAGKNFDGSAAITVGLDDLSDVTVPTPVLNDRLKFDGAAWINVPEGSVVGAAVAYWFCDDVIFPGTTPVWHELETEVDSGTAGSHDATTTSYTEMDRYVTPALGITAFSAGDWAFELFAKTTAAAGRLQAQIYRVDTLGAIVGTVLGTAETIEFVNTSAAALQARVFIAAQSGWAATDRIGVVISGKRVGGAATVTYYHDAASGLLSSMKTPIALLHNQLPGLNVGDYKHLTAAEYTGTGTGVFARATSPVITTPTLVSPTLGTPVSGTLTNCTGLPVATGISGTAASITVFLATPTSANLAAAMTDETGTGLVVFGTSPVITTPTLISPTLGTPVSGTLTNCTGLPVATGISGAAAGVTVFLATPSSANLAAVMTDETGTGLVVFGTSPVITTPTLTSPTLGTPVSGTLTNCTGLPVATGISGTAAGVTVFLATPSSANLATAITDETGSGLVVFGTSPTITTATMAGIWQMAEQSAVQFISLLSADGKYCGIVDVATAGANITFGNAAYYQEADSRWELTDADAQATAGPVRVGICVSTAAADGDATKILTFGKVRADAVFPTFSVGHPVYLSTTPGLVEGSTSLSWPTGTDDVTRVIGYATTTEEIFVNPESFYFTHT